MASVRFCCVDAKLKEFAFIELQGSLSVEKDSKLTPNTKARLKEKERGAIALIGSSFGGMELGQLSLEHVRPFFSFYH